MASTTETVTPDEARADPAAFRRKLFIDLSGRSVRLGDVLDEWQRQDFEAMDDAWRRIAGKFDGECCARAYLERPKGHSKTTDLAAMALWALFASPRKIVGVSAAAAKPQAKLLRDAIDTILRLNRWLWEEIRVNNYEVKNIRTGSELTILASNEATSHGQNPDFVICDELTHWAKRDLWDSLYGAAGKRANCLLLVISNAGEDQGIGWKWAVREACRTSAEFYFHRLEVSMDAAGRFVPPASWMTPDALEGQKRFLSIHAYKRLWLNLWQSESEEGLSTEDIEACVTLAGPVLNARHHYAAMIGAIDLGHARDHAAFVVVGVDLQRQRFGLALSRRWRPQDFTAGKILLEHVEREIIEDCQRLGVTGVAYDPWQAERMAEAIAESGTPCYQFPQTADSLRKMARALQEAVQYHTIDLYRAETLITDLLKISFVKKDMSFRIFAPRDEAGHCDEATALAIALRWAEGTLTELLESSGSEPNQPRRVYA